MKKQILLMGVFIIVLSMLVEAEPFLNPRAFDLNITLVNQLPDPVEGGEYVELRFKFENYGSDPANNVMVEIIPEYPFSLEPGESAIVKIGSIDSRYKGSAGAIVKYKLRVDENAIPGENDIVLRYQIDTGGLSGVWRELDEFKINVQAHAAILAVDTVVMDPEQIAPGGTGLLTINFKNIAHMNLENIRVKLNLLETATTTTGIATQEYPFATVGSSDELVIDRLAGRQQESVIFLLVAEPDAESKLYKVPLKISYNDWLGKDFAIDTTIGITIGDTPDLAIKLESQNFYTLASTGDVSLRFINKGSSDIKFMYVTLVDTDDYTVIGSNTDYIGKIDSDDYETSDFKISVTSKKKTIPLNLNLEYSDANNKEFSKSARVTLKLYSSGEAKKYGLVQGSSSTGIVIVLIIVGGGIFGYRRWKKRKK